MQINFNLAIGSRNLYVAGRVSRISFSASTSLHRNKWKIFKLLLSSWMLWAIPMCFIHNNIARAITSNSDFNLIFVLCSIHGGFLVNRLKLRKSEERIISMSRFVGHLLYFVFLRAFISWLTYRFELYFDVFSSIVPCVWDLVFSSAKCHWSGSVHLSH